tara:strand:+ start:2466 stop:4547 length:2082 start_codon:yes stop_codon:yes gene_type:complete
MAYKNKTNKNKKKIVDETIELFRLYSRKRETWAQHAQEDKEFRLGRQWTDEQKKELERRGHSPIVVNRIHPAVETAKAMLTSNRPQFRVSAREDSDNKVAQVFNGMIEYMWQVSSGESVMRQVVDDYYVAGMGALLVYQDPEKDNGQGEVCVHDVDPLDIYIDPNSRDRFGDDAENIIISRLFTREQAKKMYPNYDKAITNANADLFTDRPVTDNADDGELAFPEDIQTNEYNEEYVRGYERYYQIKADRYHIREKWSGSEYIYDENEFDEYINKPAWLLDGTPIVDFKAAKGLADQGAPVQDANYKMLATMGQIEIVNVALPRIKQCVIIGDKLLYERVLPVEKYPVVLFMNLHTRTPYPVSDVRMVKGLQRFINKTRSLIIAHATTSTNTKVLIPTGSVDMREFEEKWAQPGVAIEVDFAEGQPMPVPPTQLPNELYANENNAKNDIDHQLGIYEMMQGNAAAAPQTYKATVSLDEFGQRKIRSKQMDIEVGLTRMAEIAIPMMQQLYKKEKVFRIVQPNNSINEFVINKKLVDDKTKEIEVFNDIGRGKYDIIAVSGSTMPTNRYAQLELYMEAYKNQIIDKVEVLKKSEVFDMQGILERTDMVSQLQSQLNSAQEQIKKLKGDLQTRDRESVNLRKKVEVEKFKGQLDKVQNKSTAAGTIFEKRLDDVLNQTRKELMEISSSEKKSSSK